MTLSPHPAGDLFGKPAVPAGFIRGGAHLSNCGTYRWALTRYWEKPDTARFALWIMCNPSTADANADDPTIREVIRRTRSWGYGGAEVVNVFPFRSSSPAECAAWYEAGANEQGEVWRALTKNIGLIGKASARAHFLVAAWGAAPFVGEYIDHFLEEVSCAALAEHGDDARALELHCLGVTADGSPKHPLARGVHRIPREQVPVMWRSV